MYFLKYHYHIVGLCAVCWYLHKYQKSKILGEPSGRFLKILYCILTFSSTIYSLLRFLEMVSSKEKKIPIEVAKASNFFNRIFAAPLLLFRYFVILLPIYIPLSLVYLPSLWVNFALLVDFYTPWVMFESPLYQSYHEFLVNRLEERPDLPLIEITSSEASMENIVKLSKQFTWPLVIRGMINETESMKYWSDPAWWESQYANEEVLCGTLSEVIEDCTIKSFFERRRDGKPFYISGASLIFENHPRLHDMIDNAHVRSIEPGKRTATQIFMGYPDMGSDIHCAIGINVFRQIVGQKKWWFLPPSQTPYLWPSINVNGFSAHTKTLVGKGGATASPWLSRLERYTIVLNPGDVLINPPFFWHGILNLGERGANEQLVIGAPSRYSRGSSLSAAIKTNFLFTANAVFTLLQRYGIKKLLDGDINLQQDIANNRRAREKKELVEDGF